ncbi:MAG: hypothetical protein QOJ53_381 [Sphingomonadales bacterium]|jgi:hypothetical protein|nr:hypothetical protein [Sphingomonadales bacterium]
MSLREDRLYLLEQRLSQRRAETDTLGSRLGTAFLRLVQETAAADIHPAYRPPSERPPSKGRYFTFIRVDVRHGHFNRSDGVCNELDIQPSPETRARLAWFGLLARCRPDGVDILWNDTQRDLAAKRLAPMIDLLASAPELARAGLHKLAGEQLFGLPLLFTVSLNNPRFANFTAMPDLFDIGAPPLLLTNRALRRRRRGHEADLFLDWDEVVSRPDTRNDAQSPMSSDSLRPPRDGPALAERKRLHADSRHFALLEIHLVREPGPPPAEGSWDGMPISLDPGDQAIPAAARIYRNCHYTLRFDARMTRWRYWVARRDGAAPDTRALAVVGPDGADAGFKLGGQRILPDGRPAVCISRDAPLPLLARPKDIFSLKGMAPGDRPRSATLVDRLPAPGTHSISPQPRTRVEQGAPHADKPPPAWSDIYVFV